MTFSYAQLDGNVYFPQCLCITLSNNNHLGETQNEGIQISGHGDRMITIVIIRRILHPNYIVLNCKPAMKKCNNKGAMYDKLRQ